MKPEGNLSVNAVSTVLRMRERLAVKSIAFGESLPSKLIATGKKKKPFETMMMDFYSSLLRVGTKKQVYVDYFS